MSTKRLKRYLSTATYVCGWIVLLWVWLQAVVLLAKAIDMYGYVIFLAVGAVLLIFAVVATADGA
jgi:hypothetical protein